MVSTKHAFWQALVVSLFVFMIGILFGMYFESSRAKDLNNIIINSEINLLDQQLRSKALTDFNVSCSTALSSTFNFADSIYKEAIKLERYDSSTKFSRDVSDLHKRYDLLRFMLWIESKELKKKCGGDFHIVVYFYDYNVDDIILNAKQVLYSRLLADLKIKYPDKILLIPMAANGGLDSINIALEEKGIKGSPAIVIDDKIVVRENISLNELEKLVLAL